MSESGNFGCGAALAAAVVIGMFMHGFESKKAPAEPVNDDTALNACIHAQTVVEHYLKAPKSSEFLTCSEEVVQATVSQPEPGLWVVQGRVDAANEFNAMMRNYYVVRLRHTNGSAWLEDGQPVFQQR